VHAERTASCGLKSGDRGLVWRCHGCSAGGDVLALVAAVERLDVRRDFSRVLERAAELAHLPAPAQHQREAPAPAPAPPAYDAARFDLLARAVLERGRLDGRAAGLDVESYLDGRGLLAAARADGWAALPPEHAHTGFILDALGEAEERAAIATEGAELPSLADTFTTEDVRHAGLASGVTFIHPAARLIIPWKDPAGLVVNLQRRRIDDGAPKYVGAKGRAFPWPYGAEHVRALPHDAPIVLVEGAVDVLALRAILAEQNEAVLVVGLPGLAGWRSSWAALARGRVAAVALDADAAGERDVMKVGAELLAAGAVRVERRKPDEGAKDWAEIVGRRCAR
jgi:hypothetical protein